MAATSSRPAGATAGRALLTFPAPVMSSITFSLSQTPGEKRDFYIRQYTDFLGS